MFLLVGLTGFFEKTAISSYVLAFKHITPVPPISMLMVFGSVEAFKKNSHFCLCVVVWSMSTLIWGAGGHDLGQWWWRWMAVFFEEPGSRCFVPMLFLFEVALGFIWLGCGGLRPDLSFLPFCLVAYKACLFGDVFGYFLKEFSRREQAWNQRYRYHIMLDRMLKNFKEKHKNDRPFLVFYASKKQKRLQWKLFVFLRLCGSAVNLRM